MKYKTFQYYILCASTVLLLGSTKLKAQTSSDNLNLKIRNLIYYAPGHDLFSNIRFKDKAFTFGIAISINKLGKVDSVIFTNENKLLDSIVSFKYMKRQLMKENAMFVPYKSTVLVTVVLVRRGWDKQIGNFYDNYYKNKNPDLSDFDENLLNLLPNIEKISTAKKVKLLPTINFVQPRAKY